MFSEKEIQAAYITLMCVMHTGKNLTSGVFLLNPKDS